MPPARRIHARQYWHCRAIFMLGRWDAFLRLRMRGGATGVHDDMRTIDASWPMRDMSPAKPMILAAISRKLAASRRAYRGQ